MKKFCILTLLAVTAMLGIVAITPPAQAGELLDAITVDINSGALVEIEASNGFSKAYAGGGLWTQVEFDPLEMPCPKTITALTVVEINGAGDLRNERTLDGFTTDEEPMFFATVFGYVACGISVTIIIDKV